MWQNMNILGKLALLGVTMIGGVTLLGWFFDSSGKGGFTPGSSRTSNSSSYLRNDDPRVERSPLTGDKDCNDFASQSEAQEFFERQGGPNEDSHNLDRNGDGIVCESLP